ncbi:MAG: hypothetical protein OXP71_09270 [Candidatus Poribacteria bacterium]|nr:hypothetical protein [Candidatus Poribacteria bacterium]
MMRNAVGQHPNFSNSVISVFNALILAMLSLTLVTVAAAKAAIRCKSNFYEALPIYILT